MEKHRQTSESIVDSLRNKALPYFMPQPLPNEFGITSVFGGKLKTDASGRMFIDMKGFMPTIDRLGDKLIARPFDDNMLHHMPIHNPIKAFRTKQPVIRHGRSILEAYLSGAKRYRGTAEDIVHNIERLHLTDAYGSYKKNGKIIGVEIKRPEIYTKGMPLWDIIMSNKLQAIDRLDAYEKSAEYIKYLHDAFGYVGEIGPWHIIFQHRNGNKVENPILNVPDVVVNDHKLHVKEMQSIELTEFLFNIAIEEGRSGKSEDAKKAIAIIIKTYGNKQTIETMVSFLKRGRLPLAGDYKGESVKKQFFMDTTMRPFLAWHNRVRLRAGDEDARVVKDLLLAQAGDYLQYIR